ncbi:MAG: histidine phosphatase family protein [Gammaproteobacteria bacterium HGW-Gammaproteobacteria-2]|jgi:probable phosphoglycerate mutase|nr:MAG: histidine phosphatase family protein [Gammaproteobacteria bacterium HGW-Gammaproteobacteria-2]
MRILLARHGETPWNAEGRYQGQIDIPLSDAGERQARLLGQRLSDVSIDRAVASPLQRARRTAELALGDRAGMLSLVPGLSEIAHGTWEGKLAGEIAEQYPVQFQAWREAPQTVQMPEGESLKQVFTRVWPAFVTASEGLSTSQTLLVVAHDAVNRLILCHILGIDFSQLWRFRQAPATLNLLEGPSAERLDVVRLNDCAHHTGLFGEAVHRAL